MYIKLMKLVKDKLKLSRGTKPCDSIEEGEEIGVKLTEALENLVGLAFQLIKLELIKPCVLLKQEKMKNLSY